MRFLRYRRRPGGLAAAALALLGAAPLTSEITVFNRGTTPLVELYVSAADEDSWGNNRLEAATLLPGQSYRVAPLRGCRIDVRAIYASGVVEDKRDLDACRSHQLSFTATATAPATRRTTIVNHTSRAIIEVYVSAAAADDWGEDLVAAQAIAPGETHMVTSASTCRADLRVVFDNHAAEERRDIDICLHPELDIHPGWTTSPELEIPARGG